jgi:cyclic AMP-dependent transcription factor ATF-2
MLGDLDTQFSISAPQGLVPGGVYAGPTYYTPNNSQISGYDHAAISPMNTNYAIDRRSSESGPSYQSPPYQNPSALAPEFATYVNGNDSSLFEQRHDSLQASYELHPQENAQTKVGRRRGSEYAEPGSARAIYLEKNRKAASKCRSKQKRQQDDLVEAARDVERRNKILKAEVEILKSGMRDLMELVGQHTACPDARLQMYVQREADRLVTASQRGSLPTPSSGRSYSEFSYTDKPSSPDEG